MGDCRSYRFVCTTGSGYMRFLTLQGMTTGINSPLSMDDWAVVQ